MLESNIMINLKLYIFAIMTTFIVAISIFCFEIQQVNSFRQYVDAQIERNGGLTINAMSNIDDYNEKHYKGRFRVSSNQLNQKLPFGSIVDYQIVGEYKILFFNLGTQSYPIKGSSISLVR